MNKIPDVPIGSTTPRLRAVQSNITTNATIECADGLVDDPIGYIASTSTSNSINNNNNNQRRGVGLEMAKRTEAEPLLGPSPSHEIHYTDDNNLIHPDSVHLNINDQYTHHHHHHHHNHHNHQHHPTTSSTMNSSSDENSGGNGAGIHSYRDLNEVDREMLIADKPVSIRTHSSGNVYLLNFLAFLFVFVNMTLNLTVLSIIHERVPMNEPHLPDIAFDILPDHRQFLDVTEYFIVFQMTSIFILLFFHRHRSVIFRRVCIIMGVIYFFRAICMASTQLPLASRNYQCSPQLKNSSETADLTSLQFIEIIASRVFYMSIGMGLSINGHHSFCGDYIFSGHTVILLLTFLTFQEYLLPSRRRTILWRLFQVAQIGMTLISIICVIIARGHYFIDVIIAYFVTTRIFWIYHAMCGWNSISQSNHKSTSPNYFQRLWWWPVFVYFENVKPYSNLSSSSSSTSPLLSSSSGGSNNPFINAKNDETVVSVHVQRKFEWPLPWPKRFIRRKHRNESMA